MVAESGLERALGMVGIALDERGSPVVDAATAPTNTRPAMDGQTAPPTASERPVTATDGDGERATLDETVAALIGTPEPGTDATAAPATTTPETAPAEPSTLPPEVQSELDELRAERAQRSLQDKIDERQDEYNVRWNEGQDYWTIVKPAQVRENAAKLGSSELEVAEAMLILKDRHRQWNETFLVNEAKDPLLRPDGYATADLADQLIAQHKLAPEDRAVLLKYVDKPEVMKDLAATLGTRVSALDQRTQAARTEAAQQQAAHLSSAIDPNAPAISSGAKLPYKWQGGEKNYDEALAFSKLLQGGALRARS